MFILYLIRYRVKICRDEAGDQSDIDCRFAHLVALRYSLNMHFRRNLMCMNGLKRSDLMIVDVTKNEATFAVWDQ